MGSSQFLKGALSPVISHMNLKIYNSEEHKLGVYICILYINRPYIKMFRQPPTKGWNYVFEQ